MSGDIPRRFNRPATLLNLPGMNLATYERSLYGLDTHHTE